jgi:tetratricopeptide (TPR) repeat protein
MSRAVYLFLLMSLSAGMWAQEQTSPSSQSSSPSPSPASPSQSSPGQNSSSSGASNGSIPGEAKPTKKPAPDLTPPRSDRVNAADLGEGIGESSSKDTQIDLTPPADDAKKHPESSEAVTDLEGSSGDVAEFHPWNPHKAAKDVEVGDFYFKRKNYRAAEDRYREALLYKDNDAIATFRLAVCLEKLERPSEAREEYESYLRILPHGPQAEEAQKAIGRLKGPAASANQAK